MLQLMFLRRNGVVALEFVPRTRSDTGIDWVGVKPPARGGQTGHVFATHAEWACGRLYLWLGRARLCADLQGHGARQFRAGRFPDARRVRFLHAHRMVGPRLLDQLSDCSRSEEHTSEL